MKKSEANELHVDHPNGNPETTSQEMSGWDYFYMYRRQHKGGITLWPVCDVCHYLFHRTREDDGDTSLSNHRKYLMEYEDVDADLELARRRERKQERLVEYIRNQEKVDQEPENGRNNILREVKELVPDEAVEIEEVLDEADCDNSAAKDAINQLKRDGDVFEPKAGHIQAI